MSSNNHNTNNRALLNDFQRNNCDGCVHANEKLLYTGYSACTSRRGLILNGRVCTNRKTHIEQFVEDRKN